MGEAKQGMQTTQCILNPERKNTGIRLPNKKNPEKKTEEKMGSFSFRLKIGEDEVEIRGTQEEVTKTIENLPSLVPNIHKALENLKPKTVATLTVKTEAQPKPVSDELAQTFPKIAGASNCEQAIFRILETDWGKWRPRTVEELKEAIRFNGLKFSDRVLSETLDALAKKGKVRRWNTNTGFVYILAEKKDLGLGEEVE
jgi:DNA-binding HxlR family transcriptional regulator